MGESACLVHSFSYSASISHESHEDNPLHALSQSISFGRFMTDSLEWGKWSSFSHKKYVEEAEKFSRPGSVAQKKAFFEAHYKRIAEAKKASAAAANELPEQQASSAAVLPNASEPDPAQKQEVKEHTSETGLVTVTDGSGLNVEKDVPERRSFQMDSAVSEKDSAVENLFHNIVADDNKASDDVMVPDEMKEKENYAKIDLLKKIGLIGEEEEVKNEDVELLKKNRSVGGKDEGRRSVTKNSPGWRVSVEISAPPRTSDAAATSNSFSEKRSERMTAHNSLKKDERPARERFSFLNCLMTKAKTQDHNVSRKTGRKQEKKPKKRSLFLCFKPQTLGETEAPRNHKKKVKGQSQSWKL